MAEYNHPLLLIIFILFCISFLTEISYYLYFYLGPSLFMHPKSQNENKPVSVIICARNEQENLIKFLPAVLEQDYPEYEVILVNDCSEDESYNILGGYLKKYPHLKVSNISKDPKFTHNKKFAQLIGIKAAKNEILLFTDADCRPESNKWLSLMVSRFDDNTDFVIGYGGYMRNKGLLNRYIRYDSMVIAMQYLGMALKGMAYMGVGRNLAYRKSFFFEKKGFGIHTNLPSGDDDLFVNANATKSNVAAEFRKEAHTRSVPASGCKEFFRQKRRHLTTARYYKPLHKALLITEPAARTVFYTTFIVLLSNLYLWELTAGIFGIRLLIQITVFLLGRKRFNERGLLLFVPIFDMISPFINTVIYFGSRRHGTRKYSWN